MISEPSLCENLIVEDHGRDLHNPVSMCGKLKLPTEMYCTECSELIESHKRLEKGE